jgi:hypothetical protein
MRKFLFVLASTVALITPAVAQYGYQAFPPYTVPDYAPRYRWEERARSAPQMPENSEKQRKPNNALSGPIGLNPNAVGGECAKGFSEETCRRRGQKYNPPRQN